MIETVSMFVVYVLISARTEQKLSIFLYFQGYNYNIKPSHLQGLNNSVLTYHRIVEAFKFAYAYRVLLGDQDFANVTEVA